MDEKAFKEALRDLAHDSISQDYDRWKEIEMKLNAKAMSPSTFKRPRRIRMVMVIAAVLMMLTTATYAVYQNTTDPNQFSGDGGLSGVARTGQITELNLSQTIDDVEVVLNWAYMDTSRIAMAFDTFIIEPNGERSWVDNDPDLFVRVFERNGHFVDLYPNRFSGGTIPNQGFQLAFEIPAEVRLPDQAELRIELVFTEEPRVRNWFERLTGGGYNAYSSTSMGGRYNPDRPRIPLPSGVGPYVFDFTLPVVQTVMLTPDETVTVNGVTMTLERVRVAPSSTDVEICYNPPDQNTDWSLSDEVELRIGNQVARYSSGSGGGPDGCSTWSFNIFAQLPGEMSLTIPAISRNRLITEEYELLRAVLDDRWYGNLDLAIEDENGNVSAYRVPDIGPYYGFRTELRNILMETGFRVEGPWVFTLDIPAESPISFDPEVTAEAPSP